MEINQDVLLRALIKVVACLKEERAESLWLSNEVAALRNTLQELSGDSFLALVDQHRKKLQGTTASAVEDVLRKTDELIPLFVAALPCARI